MKLRHALILLLSVTGILAVWPPHAAAAQTWTGYYGSSINNGHYWCNVLGPVLPGHAQNDCVSPDGKATYQTYPALSYLKTTCPANDSSCLESELIDYIQDGLGTEGVTDPNTDLQHIGATYIINTMRGTNAGKNIFPKGTGSSVYGDWVKRIEQPGVTAKIVYNYPSPNNTAFDPATYDEVKYDEPTIADSLVFFVGGAAQYAIKLDCGNPLGSMLSLPSAPVVNPPAGGGASPSLTQPTFSVKGGDVLAGSTMAVPDGTASNGVLACYTNGNNTPDTDAGIAGWNTNNPPYAGSGDSLAAYALGYIQEFATSQNNPPPNLAPTGLSFSNVKDTTGSTPSIDTPNGMFGGMFGTNSISACADYWERYSKAWSTGKIQTITNQSLSSLTTGSYFYQASTGNPYVINNATIQHGAHVTLYVEGDVEIKGNQIKYAQTNGNGTWNNEVDIPSFTLVSHGRILIDSSVNLLQGTYVAIPDKDYTTKTNDFSTVLPGTISTCANGNDDSYDPVDIANTHFDQACNQSLEIDGSFVAWQVWLLRTHSSGGIAGAPAETFKYGPEVWLPPSDNTIDGSYQSVSDLPPVL